MKVLHVTTFDISGGAARATIRLHKGLLNFGCDSYIISNFKVSSEPRVIGPSNAVLKFLAKLAFYLEYKHLFIKPLSIFSKAKNVFRFNVNKINKLNPDIVHLHWINGGMLSIEEISKIKAPVVWSMHDNWLFTGGCHIMEKCDNFVGSCGACPILESKNLHDASFRVLMRKQRMLKKKTNIVPIGLSKWLYAEAKRSKLFHNKQIVNLPNPINLESFKPCNKDQVRILLNLPLNKKFILFGAMCASSDKNKGYEHLENAIKLIQFNDDIELVIIGSLPPVCQPEFKFAAHYLGIFNDEISLRMIYSACNVTLVPSIQENLSNTIMESLACGTPVVAFDVGGNSDLIDHKINGYLAKPFDIEDLATGIEQILRHQNYALISDNAVKKVRESFAENIVIPKYMKLYTNILNGEVV